MQMFHDTHQYAAFGQLIFRELHNEVVTDLPAERNDRYLVWE
jgi:hypothetical protein